MKRKLAKWLIMLTATVSFIPFGSCIGTMLNGAVASTKPQSIFNPNNPYFDPCTILNCEDNAQADGAAAGGGRAR